LSPTPTVKPTTKPMSDPMKHAIPVLDEDPQVVLRYAPQRIPGYLHTGNDTMVLFGHVWRELAQRIMARPDTMATPGTLLVISPEAPAVVEWLQSSVDMHYVSNSSNTSHNNRAGQLQRQIHYAVGGSIFIHAHVQGHYYHGLNVSFPAPIVLDDWWTSSSVKNNAARYCWPFWTMESKTIPSFTWQHGFFNNLLLVTLSWGLGLFQMARSLAHWPFKPC
jgi:hypothetical protein